MQYTSLGRTGLQVSRLHLGTLNFGPQTSEADSFEIMDQALEQGINFLDTANVYGVPWLIGGHLGVGAVDCCHRQGLRLQIVVARTTSYSPWSAASALPARSGHSPLPLQHTGLM
jgi:aryl-alcohol dehydrogenase-like predicted oxidoreductase